MLTTILALTILGPIFLYIINFLINRWIWLKIVRLAPMNQESPLGILFCLLGLLGTVVLIIIWLLEKNSDWSWFTPKELRKKK